MPVLAAVEVTIMELSVHEDVKARLSRGCSPLEIATRLKIPLEEVMLLRIQAARTNVRPSSSKSRGAGTQETVRNSAPEGWLMTEEEVCALLRKSPWSGQ